mgnify:FL=1
MNEEMQQEFRNAIIQKMEQEYKIILNEETIGCIVDNLSEYILQEINDKLDELGISQLKFSNNYEINRIQISAEIDEFPDKDEGYKYRVIEMGEFLGLKCYSDEFEQDKIILI